MFTSSETSSMCPFLTNFKSQKIKYIRLFYKEKYVLTTQEKKAEIVTRVISL